MRALGLAIAASALAGCSLILGIDDVVLDPRGGGEDLADAGADPDGGGEALQCDPVAQTGCGAGEKCGPVLQPDGMTFRTDCAVEGPVAEGEACNPPPGAGQSDDCQAGSMCFFGVCRKNCAPGPDGCAGAFACGTISGIYTDVNPIAGVCSPLCDPVEQTCEDADHACYLNTMSGDGVCTGIVNGGATQGFDCGMQCFLNTCAEGYGVLVGSTCAFYCSPVDTHTGNQAEASGSATGVNCASSFAGARPDGPGAAFQCRFIETFAQNASAVGPGAGVCVDPGTQGDCTACDITDQATFAATCPPGCVSAATEQAIP